MIDILDEPQVSEELLSSVETLSENGKTFSSVSLYFSQVISTVGIILAMDPTGLLIKFSFIIQIIYKLKFINVDFGVFLEIFISMIDSSDSNDDTCTILGNDQVRLSGYFGKFTVYQSKICPSIHLVIMAALYFMVFILHSGFQKIYDIIKRVNTSGPLVTVRYSIIIIEKAHFLLFCSNQNAFLFIGTRFILHTTNTKTTIYWKLFFTVILVMLIIDCLKLYSYLSKMKMVDESLFNRYTEIIGCIKLKLIKIKIKELKEQSSILKNKITLEMENIRAVEQIKKGDYSWMFTKNKSIKEIESELKIREIEIEKLNFKETQNRIHPYSDQLLTMKPGIAKIQQKRKIKKYNEFIGARNIIELVEFKNRLEKRHDMDLIEYSNSKRNFLLGGLKINDKKIYSSTMVKITNFLIFIRSSLIYITLISCPNEPLIQILVLFFQEILVVLIVVKTYFRLKHFNHSIQLLTFIIRSFLFTLFMGLCFYLSIRRKQRGVNVPVQIAGSIILSLMIVFELILAFCGFLYTIKEIWILLKQLYDDFKREKLIKSKVNLFDEKNQLKNERKMMQLDLQEQINNDKKTKGKKKTKISSSIPFFNNNTKINMRRRKFKMESNMMDKIYSGSDLKAEKSSFIDFQRSKIKLTSKMFKRRKRMFMNLNE